MKSKFGGLGNFLSSGNTASPKRNTDNDYDRERPTKDTYPKNYNQSNTYDKPAGDNRRKVEDNYEQDRRIRRTIENEEERPSSRSKHYQSGLRRSNSRDQLNHDSRPKGKFMRQELYGSQADDRRDDRNRRSSRSRDLEFRGDMKGSRAGRPRGSMTASEADSENFQSLRAETRYCVGNLSKKVQESIRNMNDMIQDFRNSIKKMVEVEFRKMEEEIMQTVEEIFRAELDNMNRHVKAEDKKLTKEMFDVTEELQNIYSALQRTAEGLEGQNWKKITGDFFKDDVEGMVENTLRKTQKFEHPRPMYIHFDIKRLNDFKLSLQKLLQVHLSSEIRQP